MKFMKNFLFHIALILTCGAFTQATATIISNPTGMGSDVGTALAVSNVTEEVGNVSLASWNAIDADPGFSRRTLTFETSDGYGSLDTDGGGANTIQTDIRDISTIRDSGNFGPIVTAGDSFRSGGAESIVWGNTLGGGTFTFDEAVDQVAFFANRLNGNLTVQLFSDAGKTSQIGSDFTLNNASGHSFFGYSDVAGSIRTVRFSSDSGQYGIDDFSFAVAVPEPSTGALFLLTSVSLMLVRRKFS